MGFAVDRKTVGLGCVTATGVGLLLSRRWSRSEGALAPAGLPGAPDDLHNDKHLSDYLHAAADRASHAGQTLRHMVRSARRAWEQQRVAEVDAGAAGAGRPSAAVLLADFLAALNEGAPGQKPGHGVQLANAQLSEWLLQRAASPDADPAQQRAVLRYLSAVLRSEEAAEALLAQPGAAPRLLALAGRSFSLRQLLAAAIAAAAPPRDVPLADARAVVALLAGEQAARRARLAGGAAAQPQPQLELALRLLLAWARASPLNASRLAEAGVGPVLAEAAAASDAGGGSDGLQGVAARLMTVLARSAERPGPLRMQGWLYHLLCLSADASAAGDWPLAETALAGFAACLLRGCELPPQLMQRSTLPLLRRLAAQPDSPARPAIALAVRALAEGPGVQLPLEEREQWSEAMLQWLVQPPGAARQAGRGVDEQRELQERVTAALEALAAPSGSEGLHVAHAWLAELIVRLSQQVQPPAVEPAPPPPRPAGDGGSAASSWWRPWSWVGYGSSTSGNADGSSSTTGSGGKDADVAAAAAAAAEAAEMLAAAPPSGEEEAEVAAAALAAASSSPYLPLDPAAAAASAAGAAGMAAGADAPAAAVSWWRPSAWWPWGGGGAAGEGPGGARAALQAGGGKPSDSELALYINAAPIGPVYARSVAAALLEASGRVGSSPEPPANAEELMGPEAVAVYPRVAAAIDWDLADGAVCQALKVLSALASGGSRRRAWLLESGLLPLLRRLTLERSRDVAELPSAAGELVEAAAPLCIQRQAVRLLAMLAADAPGAAAVQDAGWIPWLQGLAVSSDLKLSSSASRALLHLESAAATQRPGLGLAGLAGSAAAPGSPLRSPPAPLLPSEQQGAAAAARGADAEGDAPRGPGAEAAELVDEARAALAAVRRRLDRQLDAVRPPVPEQQRLVMQDGVHLFDPLAPHHEVLAREGVASTSTDAPLLDIVFVHGIRGGGFATWRCEGALAHGQARDSLDRAACWPSTWVAPELPEARLLSLEYAAPASGWEGESLPFQHIVAQVMDKLAAAGVGQRPVVFVSHSMGGLVVKELLVSAARQADERLRSLSSAAVGAIFYSVPHAGSRLADWGWSLRYVGGAPAAHVQHLKTGQHQEELNAAVRAMAKSGRLRVLSFSEGRPTRLAGIPTQVVPHESAYPGYGEFVVLHQHDHVSVCKPSAPDDPAYARLLAFLRAAARGAARRRADAQAGQLDHMEASVL